MKFLSVKNAWKVAALMLAIMLLAFSAVGCGGEQQATNGEANGGEQDPPQESIVWVFGHLASPDHPYQKAAEVFRDKLDEYTDGVIKLDIKGAGALGDEASMLELYKTGDMQAGIQFSGSVAAVAEQFGFLAIPFLFDSYEHWESVMHSEEGRAFWNDILAQERAGFKVGAIGTEGTRSIYSKEPITKIEDFSGLKMRIPENPIMATVWGSLGCIPVSLPFADVYSGLQAGLIDASENSPTGYTHFAHQEVAKYYLLTRHEVSAAWMMVADNAYDVLSPDLQQKVDQALADVQVEWFRIAKEAELIKQDQLETEMGVTITEPSPELLDQLRGTVMPVVEQLAEERNMQEFFELVNARR